MDNGASSYRRFLDGDEAAFEDIVELYYKNLVFFINRYVKNTVTAEDIAMDTFTELIVHPKRYNFKVSLKTYLFMIGRSKALNYIKRMRIIKFEEIDEQISDDSICLEEKFLSTNLKIKINEAIKTLPQQMQTVIYLIYFEEMSYEQAAKVMKKNRKQIDNLLYRAKSQLRTILKKEEEFL